MANQTEISSTTQKFLDIYDVANDLLILKDGSTALIITVNAMNFGLLAEEEQDAIIYSYAGLLNSLNYPIEIVIKSQTKDVTGYLHLLDEEYEKSSSPNKREWIKRYREFVANLIRERNVLDKKFYVVIPATPLEMGLVAPSTVIPGVKQADLSTVERSVILDKAKEILEPKRDHLLSQFGRIGLIARQLNTQEIIQLFYLSYNPEAAEGQQITDTNSYTTPLVKASVSRGGIMNDTQSNSQPAPAGSPAPSTPPAPTPAPGAGGAQVASTPVAPASGATPTPVATPTPTPTPSAGAGQPVGQASAEPNLTAPSTSPVGNGGMGESPTPQTQTSEVSPTEIENPQAAIDNLANEVSSTPTPAQSGNITSPGMPGGATPTPGLAGSTNQSGSADASTGMAKTGSDTGSDSNPASGAIRPPAPNPSGGQS